MLRPIMTSTIRRSCRPARLRRCPSISPHCLDDSFCSPCPPRCYSSSPSGRKRKPRCNTTCQSVPKRDLKSGRLVCDEFSTVCYPRNVANCYSRCRDPCSPRYRDPLTCTPKSCYRPCAPICPRGICRVTCLCPPPPPLPPPSPYCSPCDPGSPVQQTPCGEPQPSSKFVQAMQQLGPCTYRYENHLCPWEADVTVSGTIRAHCTSTADEISNRLAGPFKAYGKRFTTDTECTIPTRESRNQRLSLGMLDDGGCLDFSKNNKPTSDDPSSLDCRVRRIVRASDASNIHRGRDRDRKNNLPNSSRDNHISWDKKVDYNDDITYFTRSKHDDTSIDRARRRHDSPADADRYGFKKDNGYMYYSSDMRRRSLSREDDKGYRYLSGDYRSSPVDKKSSRDLGFELIMNRRKVGNSRRSNLTNSSTDAEFDKTQRRDSYETTDYDEEDNDNNERNFSSDYLRRKRFEPRTMGDSLSKRCYDYSGRRCKADRRYEVPKYYDSDYNTSRYDDTRSSFEDDTCSYRTNRDLKELNQIRFWPFEEDAR